MKAFLAGLIVAVLIAIASGIAYRTFEISAEEYFSTAAARL